MSNFTPKLIAIENNNDMSIDNNKIKKPAKSKEKRKLFLGKDKNHHPS